MSRLPRPLVRSAFRDTFFHGPFWGRLLPHLIGASLIMVFGLWLHSGTMSPLSATDVPRLFPGCGYLGGTDNGHWVKVFWMLDGQPVSQWQESIYLRRILYPLLSYPFYKIFGFLHGGFAFNIILSLAMLWAWGYGLFVRNGRRAAVIGVWLLATYPGLMYWGGLPYSQAAIVPCAVFGFLLINRLVQDSRIRSAALIGLGLGVLSQAYDLAVFFAPAVVMALVWLRKPLAAVVCLIGIALPFGATAMLLLWGFEVPSLTNSNVSVYAELARAYVGLLSGEVSIAAWLGELIKVPGLLIRNYLDSNFWVLPLGALAILPVGLRLKVRPHLCEVSFALAVLALFLFIQAAPPYQSAVWEMKGGDLARLYQALFVPLMSYSARVSAFALRSSGRWPRNAAVACITVVVVAQAGIIGDGYFGAGKVSGLVYSRFYVDKGPDDYARHLERYGRRPLGACWRDHPDWPETYEGET